jgi:hypothetical protein
MRVSSSMPSLSLTRRIGRVVGYPPLCEMSDLRRREFHEPLLQADRLEDLPGKWQAAILKAEQNRRKLRPVEQRMGRPLATAESFPPVGDPRGCFSIAAGRRSLSPLPPPPDRGAYADGPGSGLSLCILRRRPGRRRGSADTQAPLSVAIKSTGDDLRGPPVPDFLQSPLAGKRPGDGRLPNPVEISLGPRGLCQCVEGGPPIPLNVALRRTPSAVTVGFDRQSPPPRYVSSDRARTRDDPIGESRDSGELA